MHEVERRFSFARDAAMSKCEAVDGIKLTITEPRSLRSVRRNTPR